MSALHSAAACIEAALCIVTGSEVHRLLVHSGLPRCTSSFRVRDIPRSAGQSYWLQTEEACTGAAAGWESSEAVSTARLQRQLLRCRFQLGDRLQSESWPGFSVMATPCKLALASPRQGFPFLSYTMNVTWLGTTGQPQFAVGAWQLPRSTTDLVVKELLLD